MFLSLQIMKDGVMGSENRGNYNPQSTNSISIDGVTFSNVHNIQPRDCCNDRKISAHRQTFRTPVSQSCLVINLVGKPNNASYSNV